MHFLSALLPAVLVTGSLANPLLQARATCAADNCARAVTGANAQPAAPTRSADCSSFMAGGTATPAYASACSGTARYSSACSCFGVTAAPTPTATCLTDAQATNIVNQFASLLINPASPDFVRTAIALLADDFTDTSDSIDILAGIPLGVTTFPSKDAFIGGQGQQPPIPSLQTLDIFHSCNKIAWRWLATGIGSGTFEVKGINAFTVNNPSTGQIDAVYSEFNSAAWFRDIGVQCG